MDKTDTFNETIRWEVCSSQPLEPSSPLSTKGATIDGNTTSSLSQKAVTTISSSHNVVAMVGPNSAHGPDELTALRQNTDVTCNNMVDLPLARTYNSMQRQPTSGCSHCQTSASPVVTSKTFIVTGDSNESEVNLNEMVMRYLDGAYEKNGQSISVKQLRHVIPMLIMATFECRPEPMMKKVKGMWTSTPHGWPDDVPFCDPNNGQKVHGKPRKEVLMRMFQYLAGLYSDMYGLSQKKQADVGQVSPFSVRGRAGDTSQVAYQNPLTASSSSSQMKFSSTSTVSISTSPNDVTNRRPVPGLIPITSIQRRFSETNLMEHSDLSKSPVNSDSRIVQFPDTPTLHSLLTKPPRDAKLVFDKRRCSDLDYHQFSQLCCRARSDGETASSSDISSSSESSAGTRLRKDLSVEEPLSSEDTVMMPLSCFHSKARIYNESRFMDTHEHSRATGDRPDSNGASSKVRENVQIDSRNVLESTVSTKILELLQVDENTVVKENDIRKTYTKKKKVPTATLR